MLKAKKSHLFEKIFAVYNRNLLQRRFQSLKVSGLEFLHTFASDFPLIICPNHSSWWDGLAAFQISKKANLDSFIMMEEKHLKRLFLFRRLGAFSVNRENRFTALESINYAAALMRENPKRALWIFPQGEILPNAVRPIKFYHGVSKIIQKIGGVRVMPIALGYEFTNDFKPEIFVKIEEPFFIDGAEQLTAKKLTKQLEDSLTDKLDKLNLNIANRDFTTFENII